MSHLANIGLLDLLPHDGASNAETLDLARGNVHA